jgi:hypothetical protein
MTAAGTERGDGDDLDLTKRVSIGRAADLAGVTYADIQARIDARELPAQGVMRLGLEIPLVRVADLVRAYPAIVGGEDLTQALEAIDENERWRHDVQLRLSELETELGQARATNVQLASKVEALQTLIADYREENRTLLAARKRDSKALREATHVQHRLLSKADDSDQRTRVLLRNVGAPIGIVLIAAALGFGYFWTDPEVVLASDQAAAEELLPSPTTAPRAREFEPAQEPVTLETPALESELAAPQSEQEAPDPELERETSAAPVKSAYVAEPCHYYAMTKAGEELRDILGPCLGTWSAELEAPIGVHRMQGRAVCSQHRFVLAALDGSLEDARRDARAAREQGLVPPLVKMRVQRRGVDLLKREVPTWLESGMEGLTQDETKLLALPDADTFAVESWVTFRDDDGDSKRRPFRIELRVNDGPGGDTLIGFEWLKEDGE